MMRMTARGGHAAAIGALCASSALAVPPSFQAKLPNAAAVTEILTHPNSLDAPGCVAGVFRDGNPIFVGGAGAADIQERRPLDGDSLFYTASVSKQFTALAAAKLIEEGKLSLDDDIRKYLPELAESEVPITVGMLMHHTAGIRDWVALRALSGAKPPAVSRAEALDLLFRQKSTSFTPGSRWAYSNGGYLLLSEIVARVAGMPFELYAKKTIFQPLGMHNSMFLNGALPKDDKLVSGYAPSAEGFELRNGSPLFSGSGGLMTTITDLAKYEKDWATGGKVWTPAVRKIMLTPGKLSSGEMAVAGSGIGYGGGLAIGTQYGHHFVRHGGSSDGFRMVYARMPDRKLAVVVNCNRLDANPYKKAYDIIELIEGDILASPAEAGERPKEAAAQPPTAGAPQLTLSVLEVPASVTGKYISNELPAVYHLSVEGGELEVTIASPQAPAGGKTFKGFKPLPNGSLRSGFLEIKFEPEAETFLVSAGDVTRDIRFYRAP